MKFKQNVPLMTPTAMGLKVTSINSDNRININQNGNVTITSYPGDTINFALAFKSMNGGWPEESGLMEIHCPKNAVIFNTHVEYYPPEPIHNVIVEGKCICEPQVGRHKVPLILITNMNRVIIEITLDTTSSLIKSLSPRTPFTKPNFANSYKGNREGAKNDARQTEEYGVEPIMQMRIAPIDETARKIIRCGFDESKDNLTEEEKYRLKKMKQLLKAELSTSNYVDKLNLLIDCEIIEEEKSLERFDLLGVRVKAETTEIFSVTSKDFPCTAGNMVVMSQAGTNWNHVLRAWVKKV